MPVCVHCGSTVASLYTVYGASHVHVLPCSSLACQRRFADPYIEHELTTVLLDLILVKASAYRHLLFNIGDIHQHRRQGGHVDAKGKEANPVTDEEEEESRHPPTPSSSSDVVMWWAVLKRGFALVLVDAYLKWFYLCQAPPLPPSLSQQRSSIAADEQTLVLLSSYLGVLRSCAVETLALHLVVVVLSSAWVSLLRWHRSKRLTSKHVQLSPKSSPRFESALQLFRPPLVSSALLFSQVTPLLLLTLLLLWQSRSKLSSSSSHLSPSSTSFPPSPSTPFLTLLQPPSGLSDVPRWWAGLTTHMERRLSGSDWNASVDWAIRCIIGGLSAGVGLAVLLPRSSLVTTLILLLGWYSQSLVRANLGLPSGSGAGIAGTPEGLMARANYCDVML